MRPLADQIDTHSTELYVTQQSLSVQIQRIAQLFMIRNSSTFLGSNPHFSVIWHSEGWMPHYFLGGLRSALLTHRIAAW